MAKPVANLLVFSFMKFSVSLFHLFSFGLADFEVTKFSNLVSLKFADL